ncbi:MAG: DivIVA domain-containing protein [Janthinobacterium lividum]
MPLSPEDVVEKRFNPTRVREGYAQDEVDDFLDEIVVELRRLHAESAELRGQLQQCQTRVTELSRVEAQPVVPRVEVVPEQAAPEVVPAFDPVPALAPVLPAAAQASEDPTVQAAGVIALAQRLHDEYVRDGESQRDALVNAAQEQAARTVAEAEVHREQTIGDLEDRRQELEVVIERLHDRETSYREQLDTLISTQLEDLRRVARVIPDDVVSR